jgi:cobalt-zinc-cadmium efflux system membrane fusion protein
LADTQSRYLAAVAALDEHHRHHLRTVKLVEIGAASRQDLETATTQYRDAETNVANLRQNSAAWAFIGDRFFNSTSQISPSERGRASSGTLTSRSVNPGVIGRTRVDVGDGSPPSGLSARFMKGSGTIRVGSAANITSETYLGRVFRGRVSYVDPKIDPATRTAQVRRRWQILDKCSRLACLST